MLNHDPIVKLNLHFKALTLPYSNRRLEKWLAITMREARDVFLVSTNLDKLTRSAWHQDHVSDEDVVALNEK